jgi:hypothetical protein
VFNFTQTHLLIFLLFIMLNQITKKIALTALSAALLAGANLQAQTIFWGVGSGDAHTDSIGRFASTDATLTSLGWVANAQASPAASTWSFTTSGKSNATITGSWVAQGFTGDMTSPSIADGAAIFDGDSLAVAGVPTVHGANLVSPDIDLTAAAGKTIAIKFYTNYFDFQTTNYNIEFTTADTVGATWTSVNIRDISGENGVRAAYNGWVFAKIPGVLSDTIDLTACKFRVAYSGNYYFFAVDDFSVVEAPRYDIGIGVPTVGNTLGNSFSTLRVSNNYTQPLVEVSDVDYGFGAKIRNRGTANLVAADNGRLRVSIDRETSAGVWTNEVMDSTTLGALAADIDSNYTANFTNNWLPTDTGHYRVTYTVALDSADENSSNNTAVQYFYISENYYSKLPTRADGYPDYTGRTFPAGAGTNIISEFEYGSMFYFPKGSNAYGSIRLDSVLFRLYATTVDTANFVTDVNVRVYKYKDVDGDGVLSDDPLSGDAVLVALGQTSMMDITTGYKRGASTVIDVITGDEFYFQDTTVYLVTLDQRSSTGLENNAGNRFRGFFFGSYKINYGLNAALFDATPSPVRSAEITNAGAPATNDWNWIGFGAYQVPSIGLSIFVPDSTIAVAQVPGAAENFRLYPNPTENSINVEIALDGVSNVQYMMTDVSGRIVRLANKQNVQNEVVTFGLTDLAPGVYFMTIKTNKGTTTQRFIKQ